MLRYYFDLHDGRTLTDADGELHRDHASALLRSRRRGFPLERCSTCP
ncbi:hypothetical protein [Brevundimonas sp.]